MESCVCGVPISLFSYLHVTVACLCIKQVRNVSTNVLRVSSPSAPLDSASTGMRLA